MPDVSISSDDHKLVSNERVAMKLALVPILSDVILPLHEPTTRRSPTTVGVENTQPPLSNSQRISDMLSACRLGAEREFGEGSKGVKKSSTAPITRDLRYQP